MHGLLRNRSRACRKCRIASTSGLGPPCSSSRARQPGHGSAGQVHSGARACPDPQIGASESATVPGRNGQKTCPQFGVANAAAAAARMADRSATLTSTTLLVLAGSTKRMPETLATRKLNTVTRQAA